MQQEPTIAPDDLDLISRADAAKLLGCSQHTVNLAVYSGKLVNYRKFGDRKGYLDRAAVEALTKPIATRYITQRGQK